MPLSAKDPIAKWIDDFKKSDAPQFKGKSGEDRKAMAIAAYMDAKKGAKQEKGWDSEVRQVEGVEKECWTGYRKQGMKKKGDKMVPNCVPEEMKKVECPKCEGDGCSHCDDKGYHMAEKTNNLVAKHARKYNKAHVMADRKRKAKKGYVKHKGKAFQEEVTEATEKHIRMDNMNGPEEKKVLDILRNHEVKGDIVYTGETDKGIIFKIKKPAAMNKINAELKKASRSRAVLEMNEDLSEFLVVKKNPSYSGSSSSSSSSSSRSRRGAGSTSGQSVTTTSGNGYKVKRNIKTGKTTKSRYNVGGSAAQKESMDPRDFTDKAGYVVVVTDRKGKQEIKNFSHTKPAAQRYADRVNKTNRVGGKASVHKTDGRKIMKEDIQIDEATSQKLLNKMKELAPKGQLPRNSAELRKLKARAQEELRGAAKAKKAAPKKQSTTKTSTGKKHMGSMEAGDRNIVMQLRKAQDLKGNHDIIVSPKGRTTRLPKAMIDKLLKRFDSLQKPQDKRRFQIMVTKELRKRAK